jgi:hypothetical protein
VRPKGNLTYLNGKFYGINTEGRSKNGGIWSTYGTRNYSEFFSWDPITNAYQSVFTSTTGGFSPASFATFNNSLLVPQSKYIAGSTFNTSTFLSLTKLNTVTNTVTDSVVIGNGCAFLNYQDNETSNGLTYYNGKYYGMTSGRWDSILGGTFKGTIYEWDTTLMQGVLKKDLITNLSGIYPTGDLVLVDSIFYGLTSGATTPNGAALFSWNPATNLLKRLNNIGVNGTPTYCNGKLYYCNADGLAPQIIEYDIALDTTYSYDLPSYPGSNMPFYTWVDFNCHYSYNSFPKLLKVIPNVDPVLSNTPNNLSFCAGQNGTSTFTIFDADSDNMNFQLSSSNAVLVPTTNISIANVGNNYTLNYFNANSQTGVTTISVTANDGYGGSVNFSFMVTVNPLPNITVSQIANTLTAQQSGASYQWLNCNNNAPIVGETNQNFVATTNGNYAVIITNGNSCSDTSSCMSILNVSIKDVWLQNNVRVQPNPANEKIKINTAKNSDIEILYVSIKNVLGKEVLFDDRGTEWLDIRFLAEDVYFIEVKTNLGLYKNKLIKMN